MYKNEEKLKREIMDQSRHLFIFGYDNQERSTFLKNLEKDYPFTPDFSNPVALYFDSFGLPVIETDLSGKDTSILQIMSCEYLSLLVASTVLEKTIEYKKTDLDDKMSGLIYLINMNKNKEYDKITSVTDLLRELKISRDFYYESYINYINGQIENISTNDVSVPFLDLNMFVNYYKECMNMKLYFGIILDKKSNLSIFSVQAINNIIGSRINDSISIKVAVEPDKWETYRGTNGQYIEKTHDYGIVELDDSNAKRLTLCRKNNNI